MHPEVDATDPLVVVLTWFLTEAASQWVKGKKRTEALRHILPALAVLIAIALRAAVTVTQGQALSVDVFLRALAAAGVAVLSHSQLREGQKVVQARRSRSSDMPES